MRLAIAEGRKGLGRTAPNPPVGCVIVKKGKVIAKGWHHRAGEPHAEVEALRAAGDRAKGATLYVTLEPCSFKGRTGPCTEPIKKAGIARVVVGSQDPNPKVDGQGIRTLSRAGISVATGVLESECRALAEAYFKFIVTGRPFVSLKAALTLDGRIATSTGSSQWITGEDARAEAHRLRDRVDAILVGIETALADNPSLTVRRKGRKERTPRRVVLDSDLRLPPTSKMLVAPGEDAPKTLVVCRKNPNPDRALRLIDAGAEILEVPRTPVGLDIDVVLRELGARDVMHVLVEGGARVATSLLRALSVDKMHLFIAPKLIGGDGRAVLGKLGVRDIGAALVLRDVTTRRLGDDILVEGYPDYDSEGVGQMTAESRDRLENDSDEPQELLPAVAIAAPGLILSR